MLCPMAEQRASWKDAGRTELVQHRRQPLARPPFRLQLQARRLRGASSRSAYSWTLERNDLALAGQSRGCNTHILVLQRCP